MRFGCCFGSDPVLAAALADAGFDYGEPQVKHIMMMDDAKFASYLREIRAIGLPMESGCVLLPGGMPLNRLERDFGALDAYLQKAAPRCKELGMRTVVFGSGGARRPPEGLSVREMFDDVAEFLREHASPAFASVGIRIAIEPLSERPCIVNTLPEALALADAVSDDNVQVLADNFHMYNENDPIDGIPLANGRMIHAHVCAPVKRSIPAPDDGYDPYPFLKAVADTGCTRVSVEAHVDPETFAQDVQKAIAVLRKTQRRIEEER